MATRSELSFSSSISPQPSVVENRRYVKFCEFSPKRWSVVAIVIGSAILFVCATLGILGLLQSYHVLTLPQSFQWLTFNSSLGILISGTILGGGGIIFGMKRSVCISSVQNRNSEPSSANRGPISQKNEMPGTPDENSLNGIGTPLEFSPQCQEPLSQKPQIEPESWQSPKPPLPSSPITPPFLEENVFSTEFSRIGFDKARLDQFKKLKPKHFLVFRSPNVSGAKNIYVILKSELNVLYCSPYLTVDAVKKMRLSLIERGYVHKAPKPKGIDAQTIKKFEIGDNFSVIGKSKSLFSSLPSEHYFFDDTDRDQSFIVIKDRDGNLFCTTLQTSLKLFDLAFDLGDHPMSFSRCQHL